MLIVHPLQTILCKMLQVPGITKPLQWGEMIVKGLYCCDQIVFSFSDRISYLNNINCQIATPALISLHQYPCINIPVSILLFCCENSFIFWCTMTHVWLVYFFILRKWFMNYIDNILDDWRHNVYRLELLHCQKVFSVLAQRNYSFVTMTKCLVRLKPTS
mgnify:CR=1 FL=1